jgi:NAD(P)-dependent dehydrogenase (short-subunit alcohol dehydrogenase family)
MPEFASYPSLRGRTVFVSGGGSGIGASIVEHFAAQGARVGFVDIDEPASKEIAGKTGALFLKCDIRDVKAYQAAIAEVGGRLGIITALVNNAAHDERHRLEDVTPEFWDDRIAVNAKHAFFAAQAVLPGMMAAKRGSIINFGSTSWMILIGNLAAYTASKAAMHGLSRSLARDVGKHGVRVNTLVPGWIMTERQLTHWVDDAANKLIDEQQALAGRLYPADIARMVLFLASDDSKMITAQDFVVDGGWAHG